jgi:hypothetical protein
LLRATLPTLTDKSQFAFARTMLHHLAPAREPMATDLLSPQERRVLRYLEMLEKCTWFLPARVKRRPLGGIKATCFLTASATIRVAHRCYNYNIILPWNEY